MSALKRQIKGGTRFLATSKGEMAEWVVTRRVKTDFKNIIYTEVTKGVPQRRIYSGQQFGMLLHKGIIKLKKGE